MNTLIIAGCVLFSALRATTPDAWGGATNIWQLRRHAVILEEVKKRPPKVVMLGDSITHFWDRSGLKQWKKYLEGEPYLAANLGVSADRTEHVLWRITEGKELDGYAAKAVVLLIGTNNSGHRNKFPELEREEPIDTINGIRVILEIIRKKQPQAKIILCAIMPRGSKPDNDYRRRNDIVNAEICKFADGKDIFWCDFRDQYLTADGELKRAVFPDLLHPGEYGYEVWFAAIKPYLDYALADGALPAPPNRYPLSVRPEWFPEYRGVTLTPATRPERSGWWSRAGIKRGEILASGGEFDLVLFGDSIMHFWEGHPRSYKQLTEKYRTLNLGQGGDGTQHLLWRGMNGQLDGYRAKVIALMIGTNNSAAGVKAEDTVAGIKELLKLIAEKQPQAKVVLMPIFPRGEGPKNPVRVKNEQINALIKDFADNKRVFWLDFNAKFLDENGDVKWCMDDRLHPNDTGYEQVWLPALEKQLDILLKGE